MAEFGDKEKSAYTWHVGLSVREGVIVTVHADEARVCYDGVLAFYLHGKPVKADGYTVTDTLLLVAFTKWDSLALRVGP